MFLMREKMNNIAIVTLYGEFNFGNKLQNYALTYIFKKYGFSADTLQVYQSALIPTYKDYLKGIIKNAISIFPFHSKYKNQRLRKHKFTKFSKDYLNLTKKYNTKDVPEDLLQKYDVLIVGSDQVWNDHDFIIDDINYFTLKNVKNKKKVSFAASIGKDSFQPEYENYFIEALLDFDFISCRELTGAHYLSNILGKECIQIFDPTLFLSREEWKRIIKKPSWLKEERYRLLYFLGETNGKIFEDFDNEIAYINIMDMNTESYNTSPEEFVYLIANASEILTDSFHACVFSMLFGKTFTVFEKKSNEQNNKMESRILSLFSFFRIETGFGVKVTPDKYIEFDIIRQEKSQEYEKVITNVVMG